MLCARGVSLAVLLLAWGTSTSAEAREPDDLYPRLVLAGGPILGPSIASEEDCRRNGPGYYCENNGFFLGAGLNLEVRARLRKILYLHVRGLVTGNTDRTEGAYSGVVGAGIGLGIYHRYLFARGEYLLMSGFGSNLYRPPFQDERTAAIYLGHHAGLFSAGLRAHVTGRLGFEFWGGLMAGPRIERVTMRSEFGGGRTQISFLAGINVSFDMLVKAK